MYEYHLTRLEAIAAEKKIKRLNEISGFIAILQVYLYHF